MKNTATWVLTGLGGIAVALMTAVPSFAQGPAAQTPTSSWQYLQSRYRTPTSVPQDPADAAWSKEIAESTRHPVGIRNFGLPVMTARFVDGARTIVLSTALLPGEECDLGPNDVNSTRDYARCPGKLVILEGGKVVKVMTLGAVCAELINDGGVIRGQPPWKDPARWGTRGRYSPVAHSVELVTMQNGRAERSCAATIRVD